MLKPVVCWAGRKAITASQAKSGLFMLSLSQCRKIDPSLNNLTDEELSETIGSLYELGGLIFDDWVENGGGSKYPVRVLQMLKESNKIKTCKQQGLKQG